MSRRYYVETLPDGRQQYVSIKRSKSYNHRHNCDYYTVSREEWKTLVERNRLLDEANQGFGAQNDALRLSLSNFEAENHRLGQVVIPQLQEQVAVLEADNNTLRRSASAPCDLPPRNHRDEKLRHKVYRLENENREVKGENADLRFRVRELSKQLEQSFNRRVSDLVKEVEYWKGLCDFWKDKYDELREQHIKILGLLDSQTAKISMYEEILNRPRGM